MSTVQKVIIIGNLGVDPEMRYTANGSAVANMSVATTETWRDRQTSERKSETEWHKIACFNKLAENCGEYLRKGSKVYVEGKLKTRKWTGQDNVERYSTEVVAHDVQFLDSKGGGQQSGGQPAQGAGEPSGERSYNEDGTLPSQPEPDDLDIPF